MKKKFNQKGITLIALIITIIILLILAAVSLNVFTGENNLFKQAINARETTIKASILEEVELVMAGINVDYYENSYKGNENAEQKVDFVKKALTSGVKINNGDLTLDGEGNIYYSSDKDKQKFKVGTVDINGNVVISKNIDENFYDKWVQEKTYVAKANIKLEVGSRITGYKVVVDNKEYDEWYVLGAENGNLLITTNENVGSIALANADFAESQNNYINGSQKLKEIASKFCDNKLASNSRSIKIEDINRVTGYMPDEKKYAKDDIKIWKNEVKYTLKNGNIYYDSAYPQSNTEGYVEGLGYLSDNTEFSYCLNNEKINLNENDSETLIHTFYEYYPDKLTIKNDNSTSINRSSNAYNLLFANTETGKFYWLDSQYVSTDKGSCNFGFRIIGKGYVNGTNVFLTNKGTTNNASRGVRAVVTLKDSVKISENGTIIQN